MISRLGNESSWNALVICVNYRSEQDSVSFAQDILNQEIPERLRVTVVDNNGNDASDLRLISLANSDSRVSILNPKRNLGYFGAAAYGLRQYCANCPAPEWVIVSNADISFPRQDFFKRLFTFYKNNPPGVLAPKICSSFGTDQNPYLLKRPSRIRMHFNKWVFRYYLTLMIYEIFSLMKQKLSALIRKIPPLSRIKISPQSPKAIYAPHGSFVIFHRSYFEAGGNLDYPVFLFGEEILIAETAKRLGLAVVYEPRLQVIHREHSTTSFFKSRIISRFIKEAAQHCADKYFS